MRIAGYLLTALLALGTACAQPPATTTATADPSGPKAIVSARQLTWTESVILGAVEGVTEFVPISSTGHLIIADHFLGLEDERQITDSEGRPRWIKSPSAKDPEGRPLTQKAAADAFAVIIQAGAIAAVVVLYWSQLWSLALGLCGMDRNGAKLLRNVALAVLPAAVFGLTLEHWIEKHLFSMGAVIGALVVGAVLMIAVDRWQRRSRWNQASSRQAHELSPREALLVGGLQCVAMWPGTSRSMMTIVGGYCVGLKPAQAAEFSFLVGLPTLAGAALLKGYKSGPAMLEVFGWGPVVLGIVVAFISGALAIKARWQPLRASASLPSRSIASCSPVPCASCSPPECASPHASLPHPRSNVRRRGQPFFNSLGFSPSPCLTRFLPDLYSLPFCTRNTSFCGGNSDTNSPWPIRNVNSPSAAAPIVAPPTPSKLPRSLATPTAASSARIA